MNLKELEAEIITRSKDDREGLMYNLSHPHFKSILAEVANNAEVSPNTCVAHEIPTPGFGFIVVDETAVVSVVDKPLGWFRKDGSQDWDHVR